MRRTTMTPRRLSAFVLGALTLSLAACSPAPAPTAPTTAPKETASAPAPGLERLAGRWGITTEACAASNASSDGVIEIGASTVQLGLDKCTVTSATPEPSEVTRFKVVATCAGSEGGSEERTFSFVSSTPATMTWVREGGDAEPYARCQ